MSDPYMLKLILGFTAAFVLVGSILAILFYFKRRVKNTQNDIESAGMKLGEDDTEMEDLVTFQGGQDLRIGEILDAPGEVIGKSRYGTLYKALLHTSNRVTLLRFLRPACTARDKDFGEMMHLLGCIRHPNLVPLLGYYSGPRGEKLLIHPFLKLSNLSQFIRDGKAESHKWTIICRISIGIARGLDYLHTGLQKPVIHGNLKSKNILLDRNCQPYVSDFGLHLLLNPNAGQEMLEASAAEGYKAPELIKMRDASEHTDIYSFGIILLELLSGKEPINENPTPDEDFHLPSFMRNAILDQRITDLYHPDILLSTHGDNATVVSEECVLELFKLAVACCSTSPSLRPNIKQVVLRLEEVGR